VGQYNPPLSARKYKWLIMQTFFQAIFRVTFFRLNSTVLFTEAKL
jgi:hypothetical protein